MLMTILCTYVCRNCCVCCEDYRFEDETEDLQEQERGNDVPDDEEEGEGEELFGDDMER